MPTKFTERLAPRLKEIAVKLATSVPDMHWKDIHAELEREKRNGEFLGQPGTTQKHVATARKREPSEEEKPWQIHMVGENHPVSAESLADVLSAWRWHKVGQGVPFTVRMAKWVSRLRLLTGTKELEKRVTKFMTVPANAGKENEIRDGLLAMQSLRLCNEAVAIASEELACIALKRNFDPTTLTADLAFGWLDLPADPVAFQLQNKAKKKTLDQLDRSSGYEISEYQAATTAQAYGWHADDYSWDTDVLLAPLDKVAGEVLNLVSIMNKSPAPRELGELVLAAARGVDWQRKTQAERHEFVKQQLRDITSGRALLND